MLDWTSGALGLRFNRRINLAMETTIRIQKTDGTWQTMRCTAHDQTGTSATIRVPEWNGEWLIGVGGMIGNVGGNDWRIYTIHPDDCRRLCAVPES